MSKNLNSILNNVVRTLFEEDDGFDVSSAANDIAAGAQQVPSGGPQIVQRQQYGVNWDGTPLYFDQLPAADQARILAANTLKPGEAEVYTGPASFMDKVEATASDIYDKGKELGQKVVEWDKNLSKQTEPAFDSAEKTLQGAAKNITPYISQAGSAIADAARGAYDTGVQFTKDAATKLGPHLPGEVGRAVEDYGQKDNPNVGFTDRVRTQLRRTGEDIADAYNSAKGYVSDAWNNATPAQKAAALGALGTTALASGAGALYLRKKQREANKAAGRK